MASTLETTVKKADLIASLPSLAVPETQEDAVFEIMTDKVTQRTRFVCLSDTHSRHVNLDVPPGDFLLHAGDFTGRGSTADIAAFNEWLGTLGFPKERTIVIAGNHDRLFEEDPPAARALMTNCTYLEDEAYEIGGLKFYGSPWQPWFFDWAFNGQRGEVRRESEHWPNVSF